MKVEFDGEKIIVYLYQYKLSFSNLKDLNEKIKKILIKLIEKYRINLFGYSKVSIYNNDKYGNVLEIDKMYDNDEFHLNTIDLRIVVYKNVSMYLEFDDFCFNKKTKYLIRKNNKYYININNITNVLKYIEYGRINYKNNS